MINTSRDQNEPDTLASIPEDAVQCLSGLVYQVLKPGTGSEQPGPDDVVQVVYRGRGDAGRGVEASNEAPRTLSIKEVGPGLAEALQLMTVGEEMRIWIPPNLSARKPEDWQKKTTIVDLELVSVTRTKTDHELPTELTSPRRRG